jgi:D-glycero-alpha-D-manno-heptose-7-phosphate kinase
MINDKVVITKTPLRISFVGGGTDMPYFYNKFYGITINCTINKYIYVTAKYHNNFQEKYRLNYSETENVKSVDKIRNLRIKEVIKKLKITKPLYINTYADIPANSGLGSSSSFTVGLIYALCKLSNKNISKKKIAELAFLIEKKITKNSVGKQDHYAAAFGGLNYTIYKKNKVTVLPIIINKKKIKNLYSSLLLVWTGKIRLAVNILKDQKKNLKKNYVNLKLLNKFTKNFLVELKKKKLNIERLGKIVQNTWNLKKSFSNLITNEYINKIYKIVSKNIYGGKLLGAGNGGFLMIIFNQKKKKEIVKSLKKFQYLNIEFEKKGTTLL